MRCIHVLIMEELYLYSEKDSQLTMKQILLPKHESQEGSASPGACKQRTHMYTVILVLQMLAAFSDFFHIRTQPYTSRWHFKMAWVNQLITTAITTLIRLLLFSLTSSWKSATKDSTPRHYEPGQIHARTGLLPTKYSLHNPKWCSVN